jgi:hypothetical protein
LRACEREPEDRFADAQEMLAKLQRSETATARRPRRRILAAACAVIVLSTAGLFAWTLFPRRVTANFITTPYEAKIYLDDTLLTDPDGKPYLTPCTVEGISAEEHQVAFEREDSPRWEAGPYDFAHTQQIVSQAPR